MYGSILTGNIANGSSDAKGWRGIDVACGIDLCQSDWRDFLLILLLCAEADPISMAYPANLWAPIFLAECLVQHEFEPGFSFLYYILLDGIC
jgi:hypothetical protein